MMTRSIWLLGGLLVALSACGDDGGSNSPTCGDGEITVGEACDDGNKAGGDGCSAQCQTEGPRNCGDGALAGNEGCDDGNTISGDGCSSTCQIEVDPDCGNGTLDGTEACDDGANAPGDGCSATCTVESGYMCSGEPSECAPIVNANGSCAAPFVVTLTDNAGTLTGTGTGMTGSSTNQVGEAECDLDDVGAGKDHIWQFTITEARDVTVEIEDTTSFDTILRVLSQPCALSSEVPEETGSDGCSDDNGDVGQSEYLEYFALPAGTYYVVIDGYDAAEAGTYNFRVTARPLGSSCGNGELDVSEECDDGNQATGDRCTPQCVLESDVAEVEPNDATAQVLTAGNHIVRGSLAVDDIDLYTFTLTEAAIVEIETYDTVVASEAYTGLGTDTRLDCLGSTNDTIIGFYDSTGDPTDEGETSLYIDDDDGADLCSYLGPNDSDNDTTQGVLEPGTYTIRVQNIDQAEAVAIYLLDLKITPQGTQPVAGDLVINEYMANPSTSADTNCDGSPDSARDEFVELVNIGSTPISLGGLRLSDDFEVRHVFPVTTPALEPGKAFVVWGGGAPACAGVTAFQIASTGVLGLSNATDTITISTGGASPQTLAQVTYGAQTAGVSSNLSPDVTGTAYVLHDTLSSTAYSPGKRADGSAF